MIPPDAVLIVDTGDAGADSNTIPWAITVIDSMSFSLNGSTAGGGSSGLGRAVEMRAGNIATLIDNVQYLGLRLLGASYTEVFPSLQGRKVLRRPRVVLADANVTINPSQGDTFELSSAPAGVRTIKLKYTSPTPAIGESMELVVGGAIATALQYIIKREDNLLTIAEFYGNAAGDVAPYARFDFEYPKFNVASASNGTPIAITTQEAHVFVTGDEVTIAGSSDAGANGSHTVTRTGVTTFTLDGTTADGGGTGGTATGDQGTWRLGANSGGGAAGGVLAGPGA